jgi:RND family efflux transporter MFP subunit
VKKALRIILPLLVLGAGAGAVGVFIALRPRPPDPRPSAARMTVEVQQATARDAHITIEASGTVRPARQVTLIAQVSGPVVKASKALTPGERVKKGAFLARIDPRPYRAAVVQQKSQVAKAELGLAVEESRAQVTKNELKMLDKESVSPLARRAPQLKDARSALAAARAAEQQAELDLERTTITAPFDALVLQDPAEVGQVVQPGAKIATLVGTERFWIVAEVLVDQLPQLSYKSKHGDGSTVRIVQTLADGRTFDRRGSVVRLAGEIDRETRTAPVYIEVRDPLDGELPLLIGSFVTLFIQGASLPGAFEVPLSTLAEGDTVWLVNDENRLVTRPVHVAWRGEKSVLITSGLSEGDRIVVSPVSLPLEGLKVTVEESAPRAQASLTADEAEGGAL